MNGFILLILMIGVLYFALTYLKGPKNTDTNSDGITTRPFGGGAAGNEGFPQDLEGEDEVLTDEFDEDSNEELFEGCDEELNEDSNEEFDNELSKEEELEIDEAEEEHDFEAEETEVQEGPKSVPSVPAASAYGSASVASAPANSGVVLDSEVRIDTQMTLDTDATGKKD